MRIRCFAIAGAGPRIKSVPLQLKIWCSCITQRERACSSTRPCTVLLKMIGAGTSGSIISNDASLACNDNLKTMHFVIKI